MTAVQITARALGFVFSFGQTKHSGQTSITRRRPPLPLNGLRKKLCRGGQPDTIKSMSAARSLSGDNPGRCGRHMHSIKNSISGEILFIAQPIPEDHAAISGPKPMSGTESFMISSDR
jgi:hypothetical protein